MPEGTTVNEMFAGIAGRYDRANHLLSFGMDYLWRRSLVRSVDRFRPATVLDLATGSGDVAFALARALPGGTVVTGMDFCEPMLEEAREKQAKRSGAPGIPFIVGDAMNLPCGENSFDAVTVAFGVRNFEDRDRGFREILRVLRPGGALYVLEFSRPYRWFAPFYGFYLKHLLPRWASLITGDKGAYDYLATSIEAFPSRPELSRQLAAAGFGGVRARALTLGTVAIHVGEKP